MRNTCLEGTRANKHLRGLQPDSSNKLRRYLASVCAVLRRFVGHLILPVLAACGGGGSDCPEVFRVLLVGDSTMLGTGDMVQRELGSRALVWNRGQNGATSADALNGYRGQTLAGVLEEFRPHIVVSNYGMGDMRDDLGVAGYTERLRSIRAMVGDSLILQTPNPATTAVPFGSERAAVEIGLYAQAARRVAVETGTPLADAQAYVLTVPGWQALMADGIHPGPELHRLIVRDVTVPAIRRAMGEC